MDPISTIVGLASTILNKIWGNKDDQLKREFILALQTELNKTNLAKAQIDVNVAEANNPNRKWVTWRELLGYIVVIALSYQWFILPIITLIAQAVGHPVDMKTIFTVDIVNVLYIMCGMLGLDFSPLVASKVKSKMSK